jgi:hypothetical protein
MLSAFTLGGKEAALSFILHKEDLLVLVVTQDKQVKRKQPPDGSVFGLSLIALDREKGGESWGL